jgi:HlyD family secretion protein
MSMAGRWWLALGLVACAPVGTDGEDSLVTVGTLLVSVDVSGTINAVDSQSVGPPPVPDMWNFKVAMMAPEGESVAEGTPVLAFDPSELSRRLDEKIAERDAAAIQLELKISGTRVARQDERLAIAQAESELRKARVKADAPAGITAVIELEKARRDLELAERNVEYLRHKSKSTARRDEADVDAWRSKRDRAENRVKQLQAAIEQMTVLAPRAGTTVIPTDSDGTKKKVGDSAWRAESVLQIVSLDEMMARGEIDEVDISRVAVGQPVSLRLEAQTDLEIRGKVEKISHTVARTSRDNPLKIAKLDLSIVEAGGVKLRPGMRFRGKVETERHEGVLLLPLAAVVPTADGPVVYRRTADGIEPVVVELGPRNAEQVVVASGLGQGDAVMRAEAVPP